MNLNTPVVQFTC